MQRPPLVDVSTPTDAIPAPDRRSRRAGRPPRSSPTWRAGRERLRRAGGRVGLPAVAWMLLMPAGLAEPVAPGDARPAAPRKAEPLAPPPAAAIDPADLGYALGYRIGARIRADHASLEMPIDHAALARGLADAVQEAAPRLDEPRLRAALAAFEEAMQRRQEAFFKRMAEAARQNLAKGRDYLSANGRRPGVVTLPSGLQYEVLRAGTGAQPAPDDIVIAHYRGTHIDGREFDGTDPAGEPAAFPLRGVVPGWQEALSRMAAGAKWRIHLPPDLAYGEDGSPPAIEPNEVLVFEIELIRSERPQR